MSKDETRSAESRKHAKRMLREENQREASRFLKKTFGKTAASSVEWIEVKSNGEKIRYDSQEDVETKIMECNEKRFHLVERLDSS